MEKERKADRYRKRLLQLENEVSSQSWRDHWLELSEHMLPGRSRYLTSTSPEEDNKGDKRGSKIINGSVCDAVRTLSAGLQGGLTSPSRPWFQLTLPEKELIEYGPVRSWLDRVRRTMLNIFQKSNFYSAIHAVYEELIVFGTAPMMIYEDFDTIVRFRPFTVGEYFLASDAALRVNTLYRRFSMTARQLVEEFGIENCSTPVQDSFRQNRGENRFTVVNAIQPNVTRDPAVGGSRGMPFESVYFEERSDGEKLLGVKGFRIQPFVAPRWTTTATDVYGRSPGMMALGDVKMLQAMEKKSLKALDKMIDPPMNAPASYKQVVNMLPGGVNYIDVAQGQQGITPAYQIRPQFQDMEFKVDRVEQRLRRYFFNDMFQMLLGREKQMTAREVAERHEEKLVMIGPVLERLQSEMLGPIIRRLYDVMLDLDLVPEAPPEIEGMPLEVQYISLLAQAQQMVSAPIVEQFAAFTGNLAAVNPEVLDKVNFDQVVDEYGSMLGVPPDIIRSDDEVDEFRAARQQAQQQQVQQEQALQAAQGAKTLSEANISDENALGRMLGGVL